MKKILTAGILAILLTASSTAMCAPRAEGVEAGDITIIAHRCNGNGGTYAEDSSVACVYAAATGAKILDGDIRFTSTSNPVILHNPDLGIFGAPEIDIDTVSTPVARSHLSPSNENMMTLTQFRDTVIATDTSASLETKSSVTAAQWTKINTILLPIKSKVFWSAFDLPTLELEHTFGYDTLALNTNTDVTSVPAYVDIVIEKASMIDAANVSLLNSQGVEVWCFSCNTPEVWASMVSMGVTGFATDDHNAAEIWVDTMMSKKKGKK